MAFTDRVVEHPGRVRLTNVSGDIYDITPYEGEVTAPGTLLNAANLNQQTQLDSETAQGFSDAGASMDKQNDMSGALAFLLETDGSQHQGDGQHNVANIITTSKGTLSSAYVVVYGKVAQLNITFKNTTAQATNVTVYTGTISDYKPKQVVNGFGSIQGHPLIGTLNSAGAIDIRNVHTASVTVSSETRITFTYVLA